MAEPSRESDLTPATAALSLMATLLSCRSLPEIESNRGTASPASFELVTTEVFGPFQVVVEYGDADVDKVIGCAGSRFTIYNTGV